MKKYRYILFSLLSLSPSIATQKVSESLIIASTLVLSNKKYDKNVSLDLHKAIEQGCCTSVEKFINNTQVDVNAKVDYYRYIDKTSRAKGITPLMYCCATGDVLLAMVQGLLGREDINVNLQTNYGTTPLIACSWKGDQSLNIAKQLVERKDTDVNLADNDGTTPLIMCCDNGDQSLEIARLLLTRKDIDVNLADNDGATPLIQCCIVGDKSLAIAELLLERKDTKVNFADNDDKKPLDKIIQVALEQDGNYHFGKLWDLLLSKGALIM